MYYVVDSHFIIGMSGEVIYFGALKISPHCNIRWMSGSFSKSRTGLNYDLFFVGLYFFHNFEQIFIFVYFFTSLYSGYYFAGKLC